METHNIEAWQRENAKAENLAMCVSFQCSQPTITKARNTTFN